MKFLRFHPDIWAAILLQALTVAIFEYLHLVIGSLAFSQVVPIGFTVVVAFVIFIANKYAGTIRKAGIIKFHNKANDTIENGLREAKESYNWLGTSANFVVGSNTKLVHEAIEPKLDTHFLFITLDHESEPSIYEQAKWQLTDQVPEHEIVEEANQLRERICRTKKELLRIHKQHTHVHWEGYGRVPTFRVFIVDENKIYVSFYEKGKQGPEGNDQIEIRKDSVLGRWFTQFFEKSRTDARLSRCQCALLRFLLSHPEVPVKEAVQNFLEPQSEEDRRYLDRIIRQLKQTTPVS